MATLSIWNRTDKRIEEVKCSCAFTMHGERFAAHRDIGCHEQWRVSHIASGGAVGPAQPSRTAALLFAKMRLQHMSAKTVRDAIEGFTASMKIEIARVQEQQRKAQQRLEERRAKAAAKRAAATQPTGA